MATARSVTIGIFDDARDVARAVERLGVAGFEDTIVCDAATDLDQRGLLEKTLVILCGEFSR